MTLQWKRHQSTECLDDEISVELAVSFHNVLEFFFTFYKKFIGTINIVRDKEINVI